MKKKKKIKKLP